MLITGILLYIITYEEFMIDTNKVYFVIEDASQHSSSLAFDGTNYFAVWIDEPGVYGSRASPAGNVLDQNIPIATGSGKKEHPSVAWCGSNYLVVWAESSSGNYDIYGTIVTSAGEILDPGGIPIIQGVEEQKYPSVIGGDNKFFIVWQDSRDDNFDIYGARLNVSGDVLDSNGIPISQAPDSQSCPVVDFSGENYLVVWQDCRTDTPSIWGARVNTSGILLDTNGIAISSNSGGGEFPALTFGDTNYFVVWGDARDWTGWDDSLGLWGARVGKDGKVTDTTNLKIAPLVKICPQEGPYIDIAFDGENYLVAFIDVRFFSDPPCTPPLYYVRVDKDGNRIDTSDTELWEYPAWERPEVVFDGTNYMIAWTWGQNIGDYYWYIITDISGIFVDTTGEIVSDAEISYDEPNTVNRQYTPSVASNGTNWLVTWRDEHETPDYAFLSKCLLRGALIDTIGNTINFISSPLDHCVSYSTIWGKDFLIVWDPEEKAGINGIRINSTGITLSQFTICENYYLYNPCIAFNGEHYLVASNFWNAWYHYYYKVYGAIVDSMGVCLDTFTMCSDTVSSSAITSDGKNFFIVWQNWNNNNIYGIRIGPNGEFLDSAKICIAEIAGEGEKTPKVAFDGGNYLAVWQDTSNNRQYIYATLIDTVGNILNPGGFLVADLPKEWDRNLSVAFGKEHYLIIWNKGDGIYGAWVSKTGIATNPFLIATGKWANNPAVAYNKGTEKFMVTYSHFVDYPYNSTRVFGKFIDEIGIEENPDIKPRKFEIQCVPNPVYGHCKIHLSGIMNNNIALKIYDLSGRLVKAFPLITNHSPLTTAVEWDGKDANEREVGSGIYFIKAKGFKPVKIVKLK